MNERYVVMPAQLIPEIGQRWTVSDRIEMRHICECRTETDAEAIAGLLNQAVIKG